MKKLFGFRLILFFVVAITMSFFGVEEARAYYLINSHKNVSFTTSNFSDLGISLDRESSYPSGNNSSTVRLTITNPNNYAVSYNLSFSNSNVSYMVDGALGATYTVNAKSSKTNVIEITGATGSSITITVSSVLPYRKQFTKVITFDNSNPTTSITFNSSTQTLTLSMSDTAGLDSYYFGTSENPNNNAFVDLNDVTSTSVNTTVSAAGRYYLITRDSNGNESKEYVDFYRIDFSVLNQTISPAYLIGKSGDSITLPTPTANTGYTNEGHWFTNSVMTTGSKAYGASYTVSGSATLYTSAPANPLVFNGQTINKTYNPSSSQTFTITTATNGTGSYAYSEVSEQNSGANTNYITLSGTTATIAAGTPAGTYTYVVNALDNNSASTANATYTVVIDKKQATLSNIDASKTLRYPYTESMSFSYDGDGELSCVSSDTTKVTCEITGSGTNRSLRLTPVGVTSAPVAVTVSATAGTNYSAVEAATAVTVNPGNIGLHAEVSGDPIYGNTLIVNRGGVSGRTDTYQWYYTDVAGATSGGTAIEGATDSSYKIGHGLVGKYIYVVVSSTKENYTPMAVSVAVDGIVTKRTVTASINNCSNKTYDGSTTIACTLSLSNKVAYDSISATGTCGASDKNVGTGKTVTCNNITLSGSSLPGYELSNTTVTKESAVDITAKPVTPSVTSCTDRAYNGATSVICSLSTPTGISGETLATSGTCTVANANAGNNKAVTCSGIQISGSYASNYTLSSTSASGTVNITKVALTVTADDKSKIYGSSTPSFTSTITGFVNSETTSVLGGTISYAVTNNGTPVTVNNSLPAGTYTITPSGLTSSNYEISYVSGTLTVNKKQATISNLDASKTLTYPRTGTMMFSYIGDGTLSCTSSDITKVTCSIAGTTLSLTALDLTSSPVTVTVSATEGTNYSAAEATTAVTVNPGQVEIRINSMSGTPQYSETVRISGTTSTSGIEKTYQWYYTDVAGATSGGTAIEGATDSSYKIGHGLVGKYLYVVMSGTKENYLPGSDSAAVDGAVTAKPVTPSVTSCASRAYNGSTSVTCSLSTPTGIRGETLTTSGTCAVADATAGSNKEVTCNGITISGTYVSDYTLSSTSASGLVTITKAPLTVTADNKSMTYGDSAPSYTYTASGFVNSETTSVLGGTISYAVTNNGSPVAVNSSLPVGTYTITPSGLTSSNYTITFNTGTLTVAAKPVTPSVTSCTDRAYNGSTSVTCSLSTPTGVSGETLTTSGTCTVANATAGSNKTVTCSGIQISGSYASNYTLSSTSASGTVSITKVPLTVTADNKSMTYGSSAPAFTSTVTGFVNSETTSVLGGTLTHTIKDGNTTINVGTTTVVGSYTIIPSGYTSSNYAISYVNGTLTINKKQATISNLANSKTLTYPTYDTMSFNYDGDGELSCLSSDTTKVTCSFMGSANSTTIKLTPVAVTTSPVTITVSASAGTNYNATSATTSVTVNPGTLNLSVTTSGTPEYKETVIADANRTTGSDLTYQWYWTNTEGATSGGTAIEGATNYSYNIAKSLVGKYLYVEVTASKDNYNNRTESAAVDGIVAPRTLTVGISSCSDKTYDGTIAANCTIKYTRKVAGDDVTANWTCNFDNKNVGTDKEISCTEITISGSDASYYTLSSASASGETANITKAPLTVTADDKSMTYGSSAPAFTSTVTGFVNSETTSVLGGTLTHTIKNGNITINVGPTTVVGSYTIIPSGYTSSNYTISYVNGTLTINKKQATISNLAASKTITYPVNDSMSFSYDGDGELSCVSSDTTKVTCEIKGSGTSRTLRLTPKGVTSTPITVTISASAGNNYSAATSVTTSVTVNPGIIPLSVLINTDPVYNSTVYTTTSSLSGDEKTYQWYYTDVEGATSGGTAIEGATSPSYTVGHGLVGKYLYIVVTATKENYTPATASAAASAAVAAREVNPNISSCTNKVYDGTALVTCLFGLVNKKGSDSLTATGTCNASDANVGTGKTVTCTNLTLGGTHVADYVLSGTTATKEEAVDITVKPITPSITSCTNRAYNGSTSVTCSLSTPTGVSGETVTPSGTCTVTSATAGNNKAVTCSNIAISGATASNYVLSNTSISKASAVNITKVALTVTADNKSMTYGDSAPSYTYTASGFVNSETTSVLGGTISYAVTDNGTPVTVNSSLPVGTYTITPSGLTSSNYTITFNTGTLTVNPKTLSGSVTISGTNTYGETLTANVTNTDNASLSYKWYSTTTAGATSGGTELQPDAQICKAVTSTSELHTETCNQSSGHCADDGYTGNNTTITYGVIWNGTGNIPVGAAFDCDINSNGVYGDKVDGISVERFYYVGDYYDTETQTFDTNTGVLIYYKNFVDGVASDSRASYEGNGTNWHGPLTAANNLPRTNGANAWRSDLLKTRERTILASSSASSSTALLTTSGGTITPNPFDYGSTTAARLLTLFELQHSGCAPGSIANIGSLSACNFLFEGTRYANASSGTYSLFLETPISTNSSNVFVTGAQYRTIQNLQASISSGGTRPTIDVAKSKLVEVEPNKYTIGSGMAGKYIYVEVTAEKENYATAVWKDATDATNNTTQAVAKAAATISNLAASKTLTYPTVDSMSFSYDGDGTVSCASSDTTKVTCSVSGTGKIKTLTLTPVGATSSPVTVTISATAGTNYDAATSVTTSVTVNPGTLSGSVTITGKNTYGTELTAAVTNTDGANLSYQWYSTTTSGATSGGTAIEGATSSTYIIGAGLIGKYIYVEVTAEKTNYETVIWNDATNSSDNTTIAVARRSITIRAVNQNIQYGDSIANGINKVIISSGTLASGDTLTSITLTPSTTSVTSSGRITPSAAVIEKGTTDVTSNYSITYTAGTLVITKAQASITGFGGSTALSTVNPSGIMVIPARYTGDGTLSCTSSDSTIATCEVRYQTGDVYYIYIYPQSSPATGYYTATITLSSSGETNYEPATPQSREIQISRNVFGVTLDNNGATTSGTTTIYEKYDVGWYTDSAATTTMSSITPPTKTGYRFGGYYTGQNGAGTLMIDASGNIVGSPATFSESPFVIYAKWDQIYAENLSFNNTITGFNCTQSQCAIDKLAALLR